MSPEAPPLPEKNPPGRKSAVPELRAGAELLGLSRPVPGSWPQARIESRHQPGPSPEETRVPGTQDRGPCSVTCQWPTYGLSEKWQ